MEPISISVVFAACSAAVNIGFKIGCFIVECQEAGEEFEDVVYQLQQTASIVKKLEKILNGSKDMPKELADEYAHDLVERDIELADLQCRVNDIKGELERKSMFSKYKQKVQLAHGELGKITNRLMFFNQTLLAMITTHQSRVMQLVHSDIQKIGKSTEQVKRAVAMDVAIKYGPGALKEMHDDGWGVDSTATASTTTTSPTVQGQPTSPTLGGGQAWSTVSSPGPLHSPPSWGQATSSPPLAPQPQPQQRPQQPQRQQQQQQQAHPHPPPPNRTWSSTSLPPHHTQPPPSLVPGPSALRNSQNYSPAPWPLQQQQQQQPPQSPPQPAYSPEPTYSPPQQPYSPPQPAYSPPQPAYSPPQPQQQFHRPIQPQRPATWSQPNFETQNHIPSAPPPPVPPSIFMPSENDYYTATSSASDAYSNYAPTPQPQGYTAQISSTALPFPNDDDQDQEFEVPGGVPMMPPPSRHSLQSFTSPSSSQTSLLQRPPQPHQQPPQPLQSLTNQSQLQSQGYYAPNYAPPPYPGHPPHPPGSNRPASRAVSVGSFAGFDGGYERPGGGAGEGMQRRDTGGEIARGLRDVMDDGW